MRVARSAADCSDRHAPARLDRIGQGRRQAHIRSQEDRSHSSGNDLYATTHPDIIHAKSRSEAVGPVYPSVPYSARKRDGTPAAKPCGNSSRGASGHTCNSGSISGASGVRKRTRAAARARAKPALSHRKAPGGRNRHASASRSARGGLVMAKTPTSRPPSLSCR